MDGAHGDTTSGGGSGGDSSGAPTGNDGAGSAAGEGKVKRPVETWPAGDEIIGNARGKDLLYPNARHDLSGVRAGRVDEKNAVILPEVKEAVRADIAEIAAGRADFDGLTQRYTVNGRSYAVEPSGRIFPESGAGFIQLDRVEYSALKAIMRADGDLSKVEMMFSKNPKFAENPKSVQRMIDLYREYYS
ncbi:MULTISPECIES: hypothetical protein [unclassified Streptomyces]|uniref:hypothetical protein n=1 Tax=unclassified Streptomyces TaxID=2593676 RepID=UPI003805C2D9